MSKYANVISASEIIKASDEKIFAIKLTNKEWLATLSAEQFYDEFKKIENHFCFDTNARLAMIEWLDEEHKE